MAIRNVGHKLTRREAGRKGGLARQAIHGNAGTPQGRAKGGRNSLATHNRLKTKFKLLRRVGFPKQSLRLAEFLGIIMGDGHVGKYQVSFCTNSITDFAHAEYVFSLTEELFSVPVRISKKKTSNAVVVVTSSKEVSRFLLRQGMPLGNKIAGGISIPDWVQRNRQYSRALIRGLFDTDGCVFLDKHKIKGVVYKNIGMAFSSREKTLLSFFYKTLTELGLSPTQTSPHGVFLRRKRDVCTYFEVVGTSNTKHLSRFQTFVQPGGVA